VKQFTVGNLATRKTMEGQAQDLGGSWLAAADLNFSERYLAAVRRLTPADLQRVATRYLTNDNQTTYVLQPGVVSEAKTTITRRTAEPKTELFTLPNGLRLLVREDTRLPFVEMRAVFGGGVLAETPPDSGLTSLMAKMLLKGTTQRTAEALAAAIENVGGSLEPYAGNNSFGVSAELLAEDFPLGLELLFDVLRRPAWPAVPLEREREIQLASLKGQRDHLLQCAFKAMRRQLFGPAGYGLDALGTEETVRRFSAADLRRLHERLVTPENGVLAIYGALTTAEIHRAVAAAVADWPAGAGAWTPATPAVTTLIPRTDEPRDKEQAVLALGFPGSTLKSTDRPALELLGEACSDMGSRLFLRIRDELGLAYYVGASNFIGRTPGYFAFYCGTSPEKVDQVEQELRIQAELLRTEGLTADELARAKAKVIGQRQIGRQDLGQVALSQALDELYTLGYAHGDQEDSRINAVTLDDIRSVAQRYLAPERAAVAIIRGEKSATAE